MSVAPVVSVVLIANIAPAAVVVRAATVVIIAISASIVAAATVALIVSAGKTSTINSLRPPPLRGSALVKTLATLV